MPAYRHRVRRPPSSQDCRRVRVPVAFRCVLLRQSTALLQEMCFDAHFSRSSGPQQRRRVGVSLGGSRRSPSGWRRQGGSPIARTHRRRDPGRRRRASGGICSERESDGSSQSGSKPLGRAARRGGTADGRVEQAPESFDGGGRSAQCRSGPGRELKTETEAAFASRELASTHGVRRQSPRRPHIARSRVVMPEHWACLPPFHGPRRAAPRREATR